MKPSAQSVRQLIELHDLLPVDRLHRAFLPAATDLLGGFDSAQAALRQQLMVHLKDVILPDLLKRYPNIVVKKLQLYFQSRAWRDLLWDSRTQGKVFPAYDMAKVLIEQWKAAAGTEWELCLVEDGRDDYFDAISDGGHSEGFTAKGLQFERASFLMQQPEFEDGLWQIIDTSILPFDGMTTAIEYLPARGRPLAVIVPVARQWKADELTRLVPYLEELNRYLVQRGYEFEIHSPKIGKTRWLAS